ncbi:MAG TPA: hypothetical protein ENI92_03160, partial [Bacteroidetes bacterium]|nr:hypothetical protein [Bacteroidota bacterium]
MKLLLVFILCAILWYAWRLGQKQRSRTRQLRRSIRDRAMENVVQWAEEKRPGTEEEGEGATPETPPGGATDSSSPAAHSQPGKSAEASGGNG